MTVAADQPVDPATGEPAGDAVPHTSLAEVDRRCRAAAKAAPALAALSLAARAGLLRAAARALTDAAEDLVPLADAETGLGTARLSGEVVRTAVQLEMFASAVAAGELLEAVI